MLAYKTLLQTNTFLDVMLILFFSLIFGSVITTLSYLLSKKLLINEKKVKSIIPIPFFYCSLISLLSIALATKLFATSITLQSIPFLLFLFAITTAALTDAQALLISRYTSIYIVPIMWLCANVNLLSITPLDSIGGALLGVVTLGITAHIGKWWTGQEALGQGDIDLLALIGSFLGIYGCWQTLLFGSVLGSIYGIGYATFTKTPHNSLRLPFGTFLTFGALIFLLIS